MKVVLVLFGIIAYIILIAPFLAAFRAAAKEDERMGWK